MITTALLIVLVNVIMFVLAALSLESIVNVAEARVVLVNNHKSPEPVPSRVKVSTYGFSNSGNANTLNTKQHSPLPIALLASLIRSGRFSMKKVFKHSELLIFYQVIYLKELTGKCPVGGVLEFVSQT